MCFPVRSDVFVTCVQSPCPSTLPVGFGVVFSCAPPCSLAQGAGVSCALSRLGRELPASTPRFAHPHHTPHTCVPLVLPCSHFPMLPLCPSRDPAATFQSESRHLPLLPWRPHSHHRQGPRLHSRGTPRASPSMLQDRARILPARRPTIARPKSCCLRRLWWTQRARQAPPTAAPRPPRRAEALGAHFCRWPPPMRLGSGTRL